jgi:hypothetical protein
MAVYQHVLPGMRRDTADQRYDLKLWVGHSHEGAAYLPR